MSKKLHVFEVPCHACSSPMAECIIFEKLKKYMFILFVTQFSTVGDPIYDAGSDTKLLKPYVFGYALSTCGSKIIQLKGEQILQESKKDGGTEQDRESSLSYIRKFL